VWVSRLNSLLVRGFHTKVFFILAIEHGVRFGFYGVMGRII
jgi:hypothetical protein